MKKEQQPPNWIGQILEWRLPPEQYEEVLGDRHELFQQWIKERGECQARWRYILNALTFLRPLLKKNLPFNSLFFKSYSFILI
jgi:putative ABC transport system permease protein